METGIREHALLFALLAKTILTDPSVEDGETVVRTITRQYGLSRGRRMRRNADAAGLEPNLDAFFFTGELEDCPDENSSSLSVCRDCTTSCVHRCGWHAAWQNFGLLPYGQYYCMDIDASLAEGFDGTFSLVKAEPISAQNSHCIFVWNEASHPQNEKPFLRPYSFHVNELLETANRVLTDLYPQKAETILQTVCRMYNDSL